jgi:hypothetical protein
MLMHHFLARSSPLALSSNITATATDVTSSTSPEHRSISNWGAFGSADFDHDPTSRNVRAFGGLKSLTSEDPLASLSPTSASKSFSFPSESSSGNENEDRKDFPTLTSESGSSSGSTPTPAPTTTVKTQSGAPLSIHIQEQSTEQKEAVERTFQRRIRGFSLSNYARPGAASSANAMLLTGSSAGAPGSLQDEEKEDTSVAAVLDIDIVVAASPSPSAAPAPTTAEIDVGEPIEKDTVTTMETMEGVKEPNSDAHGRRFVGLNWPSGSATTTTTVATEEGEDREKDKDKDGEASKCSTCFYSHCLLF